MKKKLLAALPYSWLPKMNITKGDLVIFFIFTKRINTQVSLNECKNENRTAIQNDD